MRLFQIKNGFTFYELTGRFQSAKEAMENFAPDILIVEAPDHVWTGWRYDATRRGDERFIAPPLGEGWEYDEDFIPWNPEDTRARERTDLHAATTNDTMQALRKIREGDTSIDWDSWLAALDAYNLAIEETRHQEGYPNKVVYPKYPEKPSA